MKKNITNIIIAASIIAFIFWLGFFGIYTGDFSNKDILANQAASPALAVTSPFIYSFSVNGTLYEAGTMEDSSSPYWWLNSGGLFYLKNGTGQTIQGELATTSTWRLAYFHANPLDTDDGFHPQNLLRLVLRSKWQNFSESAYFKINKYNNGASPNRNGSNGILLFNRYLDGFNLYYTGLRVDGSAVIKKKQNGIYYTMAYKKILPGTYSRDNNINLIPTNIWIGIKSQVTTDKNNNVVINLYTDIGKTGNWTFVASSTDNGSNFGSGKILDAGFAGIRTDFMDVQFDDYRIEKT
ncbi:MAG: hypothetical protein WCT19_00835 [Candidatus Paceibacterota bacterium]|jgi:hypothetical protein